MTSTQHTPGPWFVDIKGEGAITAPDGMLIARMQNAYRDDLREYNARLIAAAPDLLAALKDLEWALTYFGDFELQYREETRAARAAIAKATGK